MTKLALGLHSQRTAAAIASIGVSMMPGHTALMRIPQAFAVAKPIPEPAPVTSATLPSNDGITGHTLRERHRLEVQIVFRWRVIPTRTERHALAQSRRPMGMTRYSLRSENPGMGQPSRGLVLDAKTRMRL